MRRQQNLPECGAVMAELAIVAPFLVFIFVCIIEFGRLFRENIWLAQTAYHAVVLGGENVRDTALAAMPQMADGLYTVQNRTNKEASLTAGGGSCTTSPGLKCTYNQSARTVYVQVKTELKPLLRKFDLNTTVNVTGPVVVGPQIPGAALNSFANDSNGEYYCDFFSNSARPNNAPQAACH